MIKQYLDFEAIICSLHYSFKILINPSLSAQRIRGMISRLPTESLRIIHNRKKVSFYIYENDNCSYIRKDSDKLYLLARKRYLKELLKTIEVRAKYGYESERFERQFERLAKLVRDYAAGNLDVARIVLNQKQYKWFTGSYKKKQLIPKDGEKPLTIPYIDCTKYNFGLSAGNAVRYPREKNGGSTVRSKPGQDDKRSKPSQDDKTVVRSKSRQEDGTIVRARSRQEDGTIVRSKSEQNIGNVLWDFAVPIHYEERLTINVQKLVENLAADIEKENHSITNLHYISHGSCWWNLPKEYSGMNASGSLWHTYDYRTGCVHIHPDYTIMLADGTLVFWEHEGLFAKYPYRANASERICIMRYPGGIPMQNIIETTEVEGNNRDALEEIIKTQILPRLWF